MQWRPCPCSLCWRVGQQQACRWSLRLSSGHGYFPHAPDRHRLQPPQPGHRTLPRHVVAGPRAGAGAGWPRCDPPGNRRAGLHHRRTDRARRPGRARGRPHPLHRGPRPACAARGDCGLLPGSLPGTDRPRADPGHAGWLGRAVAGQQSAGGSRQALVAGRSRLPVQPALPAVGGRGCAAGAGRAGDGLPADAGAGGTAVERGQRGGAGRLPGQPDRHRALGGAARGAVAVAEGTRRASGGG
ncbi:hypothetical protein D3C71_1111100 [compost metagenome]